MRWAWVILALILLAACDDEVSDQAVINDTNASQAKVVLEVAEAPEPEIFLHQITEIGGVMFIGPEEILYIRLLDNRINDVGDQEFGGKGLTHHVKYIISSPRDLEVFVVPDESQLRHVPLGDAEIVGNCTGLAKACDIPYYAGMVIVNKDKTGGKLDRLIQLFERRTLG